MEQLQSISFEPIGIAHSPYKFQAPFQPQEKDYQDFSIELKPEFAEGLKDLETFKYIYVLFYFHKNGNSQKLTVSPPWTDNRTFGVFATRSPQRPNGIGMSILEVRKVQGNIVHTAGMDLFDGTPILDIKPYIHDLDVKSLANNGWVAEGKAADHLLLHIKGIPHKH